jgi:predicted Zn-dependent protease with MMP-like domain
MRKTEFEKIVREVLKALPKIFKDKLQNIDVVIEEGAEDGDLGLYQGVCLTERGEGYRATAWRCRIR